VVNDTINGKIIILIMWVAAAICGRQINIIININFTLIMNLPIETYKT